MVGAQERADACLGTADAAGLDHCKKNVLDIRILGCQEELRMAVPESCTSQWEGQGELEDAEEGIWKVGDQVVVGEVQRNHYYYDYLEGLVVVWRVVEGVVQGV